MKIGIVKTNSAEELYGKKYNDEYIKNVWKKYLIDKLDSEDEVVWIEREESKNLDQAATDFDALIDLWIVDDMINETLLANHPKLKYVSTLSHGYGKIDMEACRSHGVTVTNTIYGDVTIAQYTMALLLDICHNVRANDYYYRHEKWTPEYNGRRLLARTPQIELYEKTIGIIGLGNIGFCVAKMAAGFGMKVISYSRHKKEGEKYDFIEQSIDNPKGREWYWNKQSDEFINQMEGYLIELEDELMRFKDINYRGYKITSSQLIHLFYEKFLDHPLLSRMDAVMEYVIDEYETLA